MSKQITLSPSWKSQFLLYAAGVLLLPLFGVGILLIYLAYRRHSAVHYRITDRQITAEKDPYSQTIDIANISDATVEQGWLQQKLGIGTILIRTPERSVEMIGQPNPKQLAGMIRTAAEAEKKRLAELRSVQSDQQETPDPGTLDKIDYLTGLWQQGLLSDEDFKKEKKHFE
ncbi:MAG: PH domain-containing protein [Balneolaceae bacterium]